MKYRYRKKGKYADGRIKIVLERISQKGVIVGVNLPKPEEMWDILKCPVLPYKERDTKSSALWEAKVNEKEEVLK